MSKENQSRAVVKAVKSDFIQDYYKREKRPQHRTRLHSQHSQGKREFTVRAQLGSMGGRLLRRSINGRGGFWLDRPKRIDLGLLPHEESPHQNEQAQILGLAEGFDNAVSAGRARAGGHVPGDVVPQGRVKGRHDGVEEGFLRVGSGVLVL